MSLKENIENAENIQDMIEDNINSQEILNAIDVGKITLTDKKKRGRPKKSSQIINPSINKIKINNAIFDNDEIILHLPISSNDIDIKNIKNTPQNSDHEKTKTKSKSKQETETEEETETETEEETDENEEPRKNKKIFKNDDNILHYLQKIKELKEENELLKKYLKDIAPVFFTEVKVYPVDLKLFDLEGNIYIPKKTNIPCFWCTCTFDWLPVCMPEKYHNGVFYVSNNYCTFNCMAADNLKINDNKVWERYCLMKTMYYLINKDKIQKISEIEINPSGPKELLKKYGGTMTIEEYRKNSKILGREYHKLMPPFMPMTTGFSESTNSKMTEKTMDINNIINANINLKRNKPLSNVASKEIDSFVK
jgi:hypothetical protein